MYTTEMYDEDKAALDAATNSLSALVVGEKIEECAKFGNEYSRIAQYFDGLMTRRVLRTFLTISQSPRITGMECGEFTRTLSEVDKMLKSKRKFFRKPVKKCFSPATHGRGCACANLARFRAKSVEAESTKVSLSESNSLEREEQRLRRELLKL